jgi:hypothetical protein
VALDHVAVGEQKSFRTTKSLDEWRSLFKNVTQDGKTPSGVQFVDPDCQPEHVERKVEEATFLTTEELSARIKYDPRTIRERLKDSVLIEGVHYIRPFGGRKILYVWERIARDIGVASTQGVTAIPMAGGGVLHG